MTGRTSWKWALPLPAAGLAVALVGLAIFHARADDPGGGGGKAGTGPCVNNANAPCPTCASTAETDDVNATMVALSYKCTGGAAAPAGYTSGQICGNTNTTGCQNGTFSCGTAFDCNSGANLGDCGIGVSCASPVPAPAPAPAPTPPSS